MVRGGYENIKIRKREIGIVLDRNRTAAKPSKAFVYIDQVQEFQNAPRKNCSDVSAPAHISIVQC